MNKLLLTALLLTSLQVQADCTWSTEDDNGTTLRGYTCNEFTDKPPLVARQLIALQSVFNIEFVRCYPYLDGYERKAFCEITLAN